jgi:O-antigen/teichoic acid export membrane protein
VALARLASPGVVGRYALELALAGPPLLAANLQLRTVFVADARDRFALAAYWRLRAVATAAALAAVAMAMAWIRPELALETALVAVIKAIDQCSDLYHGVLQKSGRLGTSAALAWLKAAAGLGPFLVALASGGGLALGLAAVAASQAALVGLVERPLALGPADCLPRPAGTGSAAELARQAFPAGVILLAISAKVAIPRYFLEWRTTAEALGYFAALSALPTALETVTGALAQAWAAPLARSFHFDRARFARLAKRLAAAGLGASAAALALAWSGPALVGLLYGPDYGQRPGLLGWLLAAGALSSASALAGVSLTAAGIFRPQAALYAAATAACGLWCFLFVGPARPAAAAEALAASAAVVAAGQWILLARTLRQERGCEAAQAA